MRVHVGMRCVTSAPDPNMNPPNNSTAHAIHRPVSRHRADKL